MNKSRVRFSLVIAVIIFCATKGISQAVIPDVLLKGTLKEQMNYIEDKTRIYEEYRAIREDMFQKLKSNSIDSLTKARSRISELMTSTGSLNVRIDTLNSNLKATKAELAEITRTKNAISILGIKMDKTAYNTIMWIIVAGLAFLLGVGFLAFKRNRVVTLSTKKELNELKEEFEAYRKKTRLEREKMSMDHFKEIQKLKGI
jgi:LPXTG-motif cell wall-anchored protein